MRAIELFTRHLLKSGMDVVQYMNDLALFHFRRVKRRSRTRLIPHKLMSKATSPLLN